MICRIWRGQTTIENADGYFRHLAETVLPAIGLIAGFRGSDVLRRQASERIEFLVLTRWESLQAIREFAGEAIDRAVVAPEARALLAACDDFVTHYDLVYSSSRQQEALG